MAYRNGNYCAFYVSDEGTDSNLKAHGTKDFVYYNTLRMWKGADFAGKAAELYCIANNNPVIAKLENQNILYLGTNEQRNFYINLEQNISIEKDDKENYVFKILDKYKNKVESISVSVPIEFISLLEQKNS